jgi:hypothetical protein
MSLGTSNRGRQHHRRHHYWAYMYQLPNTHRWPKLVARGEGSCSPQGILPRLANVLLVATSSAETLLEHIMFPMLAGFMVAIP